MPRMLLKELEGNYDSIGSVFIMVTLFFRPPEVMYQMDHEYYCAAIHLFNIRIARYFLSILHIHGEFMFITVALFISPFPQPFYLKKLCTLGDAVLPYVSFNALTARYKVYSIYITRRAP
jgi:hypothetical protein